MLLVEVRVFCRRTLGGPHQNTTNVFTIINLNKATHILELQLNF